MLLIMVNAALETLSHWANFYVIVGSAAGALTGLQFVVMTLVAESTVAGSMREISAFGTPTMVQFCVALLISAIMSVPWGALSAVGMCLLVFGTFGLIYALLVIRHARKQTGYDPETADWFWYVILPLIGYVSLIVEGILMFSNAGWGLFLIGATTLLFLFIGIRNSWDTVTYVAIEHRRDEENGD